MYIQRVKVASLLSSKGEGGTPPPQESSGDTFMFFIPEIVFYKITCKIIYIYIMYICKYSKDAGGTPSIFKRWRWHPTPSRSSGDTFMLFILEIVYYHITSKRI